MTHSADSPNQTDDEDTNSSTIGVEPETIRAAVEPAVSSSDSAAAVASSDESEPHPPAFTESKRALRHLASAFRRDLGTVGQRCLAGSPALIKKLKLVARASRASFPPKFRQRAASAMAPLRKGISGAVGVVSTPAWFPALRLQPRSWKAGILMVTLTFAIFVIGMLIWALKDVPWREIADGSLKPIVVLEAADGQPIVRQGPFQGPYARYEEFPAHLVDAVLSIEDRRFMDHYGVDLKGIMRAVLRNFQAGSVVQGGSTITQQLIKVQYLESDRTLKRKLQELVIAFWLEWKLGKREILTRYLNSVYLGSGATGMPAAARIYFNKEIAALNVQEAAMLAGLLKAPSQLNPIDNFEAARERTTTVLDAMVANGKLAAQDASAAKAKFAELHPTTPTRRSGSWFADWISPQAGEIAGASPGSTTVRTTLVPRLQQLAEDVVARNLDKEGKTLGASQAALVAMTPDGAVVAMVGGRDYKASQFNRAVAAKRQPGSTFKLFVFYAALKNGLTLRDQVFDGPIEVDGWSPQNSTGRYHGWVTIAEAFARSLNGATVALAQEVGIENVVAAARELGIDAPLNPVPALALGSSEVSLLDLTGAYASIRLGKSPVEPWGVIDFQASTQTKAFRVGPLTAASTDLSTYQQDLVSLLQLVVERGTGRDAFPGSFAAGKTGTSQNNRDAWFVGFTEDLVAGVWVGNDDDTPMKGVTGGALPARIWRDFMQAAMAQPEPQIDPDTGLMTSQEGPAASCNIRACARSYRSFRASDCTYQPYRGERRLCER
ncbi:MAG: PBP1A family penicillin-binding protein [Ensifer adhaerens]|uniref:PBP1A family penicillin-binding protein n=1 Tax=Ensifer sp. Root127 TaxID=1736440 RepID=UPI00070F63C9|nr:PBP1A family penicillin-binding protein [Ensifer sp. Root127]KQW55634.1 penicillin-binding protein [Ensifer sp. Root127]